MPLDIAERLTSPNRRTFSFYIVLFSLVVPLWFTLPASWLFVIYALRFGNIWYFGWSGRTLFLVALCEVFFSIYHYQLSRHITRSAPSIPRNPIEIAVAYQRLLKAGLADLPVEGGDEESDRPGSPEENIIQLGYDDPRAIDFRNCLSNWFCKAPWSSIRLHEVRKWLYWSIFNADLPSLENLSSSQRVKLDWALDLLQKRAGSTIQEGSNPAVHPIRITIDNVNIMWRPLTFYLTIYLVNLCLKSWYVAEWGVQSRHSDGLEYLIRVPKRWDQKTGAHPVVFIHGLGLGLLQYHRTIVHLFRTCSDRPILILLQPQISQNIFHPKYLQPMNRHQTADRLTRILKGLGWVVDTDENDMRGPSEESIIQSSTEKRRQGVTMLSHSNGSYTHTWMLKSHPKMIVRSCFIDPVTFCSWEGDVCYNFIYSRCRTGMEMLIRYFVGTEIGVANLLQRHFDWVSNSLWFEDIPDARDPTKTFFVLGGKDSIVHAERVKRYLTSHGVKKGILYDPDGRHGQALLSGSRGHSEVFRWLQEPVN